MTASLTDILSAAKNIAQAINDAARAYVGVQGSQIQVAMGANSQVTVGPGRMAMLSVITAGSTVGTIHDSATITNAALANQIAGIPMTVGISFVNLPFNNGLAIKPGTGQVVAVSYSTGAAAGDQTVSSEGRRAKGR
jgi:hypothetical protein